MVKLSKRLEEIFRMVPKGMAADIGADHGKLIIALFERGVITHGYAVENKVGPYNRLVSALKENNLIDDIIPLLSDGIKDVPTSVGTYIIAGMGGDLIIDILKKYPEKTKFIQTLIVDAHSNVPKLREEVSKLGFVIADEAMVEEDNKFYEIIKFIRADVAFYGDKDLEFGPILRCQKSTAFKQKYQSRINEIDLLLKKANLPEKRIHDLQEEKERIQGVL
ncbi:MAG: class I SAM-dependent methyltransferase [Bacilli bacterium]|nr:class I SAM-dependent methyltransferase [Bacilli bacterium]